MYELMCYTSFTNFGHTIKLCIVWEISGNKMYNTTQKRQMNENRVMEKNERN